MCKVLSIHKGRLNISLPSRSSDKMFPKCHTYIWNIISEIFTFKLCEHFKLTLYKLDFFKALKHILLPTCLYLGKWHSTHHNNYYTQLTFSLVSSSNLK